MAPVNWQVLKADFVIHYDLTLPVLAAKYDVDLAELEKVAKLGHWFEDRAIRSTQIAERALERAEVNQVEELAEFDSDCLRQAKAILGAASIVLAEHRKPHELRSLASAVESAQRIGRLCLGAAVETTQQIPAEFNVDAAREHLFNRMLEAEETPQ
jgi:hypothetical protein